MKGDFAVLVHNEIFDLRRVQIHLICQRGEKRRKKQEGKKKLSPRKNIMIDTVIVKISS